jgi:hypothetical protein
MSRGWVEKLSAEAMWRQFVIPQVREHADF